MVMPRTKPARWRFSPRASHLLARFRGLAMGCALAAAAGGCGSEGNSASGGDSQHSSSADQTLARIDARLDRFADRLAALEARLELDEATPAPPATPAASPVPAAADEAIVAPSHSFSVTLPKSKPPPGPATVRSLRIQVGKRSNFIDGAAVTDAELERRLTEHGKHPEASVILSADGTVSHARVVEMMDLAKRCGVTRYAMSTREGS